MGVLCCGSTPSRMGCFVGIGPRPKYSFPHASLIFRHGYTQKRKRNQITESFANYDNDDISQQNQKIDPNQSSFLGGVNTKRLGIQSSDYKISLSSSDISDFLRHLVVKNNL